MPVETRPVSAVKRTRQNRQLRLIDVASRAEISVGYLSMVESGYLPRAAVRERIAKALGRKVELLWPELGA